MTFISKVKQGAINGWHTHQILPSISIAQAILESASGTSSLGAKYNNLFGIKASADWSGKVINLPTREHGPNGSYQTNANFRWYDSWNDSMVDHAAFFTNTPWRVENYKHVVGETDYKAAARALQSAGYATDPQYATKLIQRIEQNNLTQYDTEAFNGAPSNVGVIKKIVGGTLTELAKSAIKQYNVTLIGDSLGVGTQPKLNGVFRSFTHDVLGSRQITHATNSLNGTYVLQSLRDYGQLKDIVVVVLGTNRGVTDTEIDNFVAIAGNRKVIFVDTNSQVGHRQSVSGAYRRASERHNNVYHASWMAHSNSLRSRYYGSDNIHMTNEGYQAHADFIKMAVYEAGVGVKTTSGTIGSTTEYIGIEDLDYKEGDLVSPKGESIIYNHPANELWGSKTGDRVIWIESILEVDSDDPQFILENAVKVMKENGQPAAQYVIDLAELPDEISIGDWGYVLDHEFNPPLYIHARVLEIITSETDLNANKAVIGNVTEVFPADKSDIKLIQADLKDARDNLVRDYRKGQPILMLVDSTNGSTLGDKYTETELVAKVTQGAEDLTNRFITYKWERASNDTASDDAYNAIIETETTNRLIITSKDIVNNLSTFVVRVYDEDVLINQSSITIKHVDTALWTDTSTPPSDAKDGATWVDETGKHWILKDGEWEERVDQAVISQVRVEVEGAMAEAEQAKQNAVDAYENAVADAKAHADAGVQASKEYFDNLIEEVETDVATAQNVADNAVEQINTAVANAGFTSLDDTIKNISDITSGVKSELDLAIENAGFTSLDDTLKNISGIASGAQTQIDTAIQNAGFTTLSETLESTRFLGETAHADAQTAIGDAQAAQSKALEALGRADDANQGVSDLDVRVDDIEGELELKANNAYIDSEGRLTTLSNAITINAEKFSSDMQRIESKVEVLSGEVNLVILRDAFENTRLLGGEVYPNATVSQTTNDTMAEMITVVPGEKIALSKRSITGDNFWRINLYNESGAYVTRYASDLNQVIYTIPTGIVKMWVSYPRDSRPQIVRGELFVPYRPNMADQMTTEEVVIFRNEYDEFADGTSRRLTAIDSSGGRLDIAETNIQTTAQGLQTAVGRIDGTDIALSTLQQTANGLQSQVFNADGTSGITQLANGLQTAVGGGRNLLSGTRDFLPNPIRLYNVSNFDIVDETALDFIGKRLTLYIQSPTSGTSLNRGIYLPKELFKADREYIFSFYGRNWDGYASINALASSGTITHLSSTDEGNLFKRHVFKITNNTGEIYIRPNGNGIHESTLVVHVVMPQLEYGSQVTPYSQSPKDAVSQSQITQLSDSITSSIIGVDGRVTTIRQDLDSISQTVGDNDTKLSTFEQTVNGIKGTVYNADGSSKITQLATGISSVVNDISELDLSGRNLVITRNEVKDYFIGSTGSLEFLVGSSTMRDYIKVTPGEVLTFTKQSKGDNYWRVAQLDGTIVYKSRFVNQANELQYTVPTGIGYLRVSYPAGSSPKIERGNKATPYSPAPEDVVTQSQITQLSDSITSSINSVDGRVSTIRLDLDSISGTVSGHGGRLSTVEQTADGLKSAVYNADGSSKITQLATGITSVVNNLSELDISGRNLVLTHNEIKDYFVNSTGSLEFLVGASTMRGYIKVTPGEVLTFTKKAKGDNTWRVGLLDGTVVYKSRFVNTGNSFQYTVPAGIGYIRVSYPTDCSPKVERGGKVTPYSPAPEDIATQSQISQLSDNINLRVTKGDVVNQINVSTEGILIDGEKIHITGTTTIDDGVIKNAHIGDLDADKITSGTIDTARLDATEIVTQGLEADVITSDFIKSDIGLIDVIFSDAGKIDYLWNKEMWSEKINAIEIDAVNITGDTANFISAGFKALNSQATINGNAIRIQNTAGEFVEMNNTPELRSDDAGGTAVVLGKGRVHFYDSRGHSKGYVGTDMHTAGSYDFGTFLSKGSGIYRFARMADATETTYAYYTVKAGITTASPIITDMVRTGLLPDGNSQQFVAKGNMISQLNGWPAYPNWPALSAGQQIRYKELTAQTTGDAYEDIWKFGPSSSGDWRIYFAKHATFEGGTTGTSDRRLKHDIAPTQIEALDHIDSLTFKEFKWNRNNSFEPLGLIAQDSGILRVPGGEDEMEGIDIQRALMLALKGIQELQEEIKQLKGA